MADVTRAIEQRRRECWDIIYHHHGWLLYRIADEMKKALDQGQQEAVARIARLGISDLELIQDGLTRMSELETLDRKITEETE